MGKHISGIPRNLWRIDGVVAFQVLSLRDDVLKPQNVVEASEIEALTNRRDPKAALEGPFGDAEPVGGRSPDQKQLADLVCCHRDGRVLFMQPTAETRRCPHGIRW